MSFRPAVINYSIVGIFRIKIYSCIGSNFVFMISYRILGNKIRINSNIYYIKLTLL